MRAVNTVIPARFPRMEAGRVQALMAEANAICEAFNSDPNGDDDRAKSVVVSAVKRVLRNETRYRGRVVVQEIKTPVAGVVMTPTPCDGFNPTLTLRRDQGDPWMLHVDVAFAANPRGAGRKPTGNWPPGMSGRGKMRTISVPTEIAEDVLAMAQRLAWERHSNSPDQPANVASLGL